MPDVPAPGRNLSGASLVLARLRTLAALSAADEAVVASLADARWDHAGVELVRDTRPLNPRILISGWAARVRELEDGRRQIIGLILPGEGIGLCRRPQPLALCPVIALTPVETLDARPLIRAIEDRESHPALSMAIDVAAALDEAWLMDQVVRLGRLTAYERLAHLVLEVRSRLAQLGMDAAGPLPFPLTQEMLADITGLSIVHVNRTLQQLRREKLIEVGHGKLRVLDAEALVDIAEFREPRPQAWSAVLGSADARRSPQARSRNRTP